MCRACLFCWVYFQLKITVAANKAFGPGIKFRSKMQTLHIKCGNPDAFFGGCATRPFKMWAEFQAQCSPCRSKYIGEIQSYIALHLFSFFSLPPALTESNNMQDITLSPLLFHFIGYSCRSGNISILFMSWVLDY